MPSRLKKKKAALKFDASTGEIADSPNIEEAPKGAPVRQVVEVVDDASSDALETIKRDAEEIEEVISDIEKVNEGKAKPDPIGEDEEDAEEARQKTTVESLFNDETSVAASEITVASRGGKSLGVWVGAMFGMALAIGLSMLFFVRGPKVIPFVNVKPTPTTSPTIAPSPTTASLSRKDIKVSVLNGGGVSGAGAKLKTFLEDLGYTVVSVGNAKEYEFDTTQILVKSGHSDISKLLKEDLQSDYTVTEASGSVDSSADYDAQVTVGKE